MEEDILNYLPTVMFRGTPGIKQQSFNFKVYIVDMEISQCH